MRKAIFYATVISGFIAAYLMYRRGESLGAIAKQAIINPVGSLVSEVVAERGLGIRVLRQNVGSMPDGLVGSQRYMERSFGLSADQLAKAVIQEMAAR